jgi:hypothetical protein
LILKGGVSSRKKNTPYYSELEENKEALNNHRKYETKRLGGFFLTTSPVINATLRQISKAIMNGTG